MDNDLFNRIRNLLILDFSPGRWGAQIPGKNWTTKKTKLRHEDVAAHLSGDLWIGCRLPEMEPLDRIILDIDCKVESDLRSRDERYWLVRQVFGEDRVPIVYGTPTGEGLRMGYRIPKILFETLRGTKGGHDPLAVFLNDHKLWVRNGNLEVFPARNQIDRLPLGRSMPILCPKTLEPLIGERGRCFETRELEEAVRHFEAWHAQEDPDLLAMILGHVARPSAPRIVSRPTSKRSGSRARRQVEAEPPRTPHGHILPLLVGLQAPSTRYAVEFTVGAALCRWPEQFPHLQLGADPSRRDLANGLALWLSDNHNDLSEEWSDSFGRLGRRGAIDEWRDRYLTRGAADDLAPIDRMLRAARSQGRWAPDSTRLTTSEHWTIYLISQNLARNFSSPMDRYQWEVWTSRLVQEARRQVARGGRSGDGTLLAVQIAAKWMQEWPFGRNFRRYLNLLLQEPRVAANRPARVEILWKPLKPDAQTATIYRIPWLDLKPTRRSEPDTQDVESGIAGMTHQRRCLTVGEAYHAIDRVGRGGNLERIYGPKTAQRLLRIAAAAQKGRTVRF